MQDCSQENANLFLKRFTELSTAFKNQDPSYATFPRLGTDAMIEIQSKMETMVWVLDMLNIEG